VKELQSLTQFDPETWLLFSSRYRTIILEKNTVLLDPGKVCKHIFFIEKGLLRSFYIKDGEERNLQFSLEGSFATDLKSLRGEQPSELTIQAIEPTTVCQIAKTDLVDLYGQSHQIEAFGRSLLEKLLAQQEEYSSWFQLYSARERYELLQTQQPALLQRLSLTHLASFLGIRRETLSRVRGRL
jgi:CRP-like cAMP-binding protein